MIKYDKIEESFVESDCQCATIIVDFGVNNNNVNVILSQERFL